MVLTYESQVTVTFQTDQVLQDLDPKTSGRTPESMVWIRDIDYSKKPVASRRWPVKWAPQAPR